MVKLNNFPRMANLYIEEVQDGRIIPKDGENLNSRKAQNNYQ